MSAQPESPIRERALRLGFLGLGWIGRKRLDALAQTPGIRVAAVADADDARTSAAAQAHPGCLRCRDLAGLLECGLDGIVIATPNACHAQQVLECLQSGVAVFCQKPLAINAQQTQQLIAAAQAANRLLAVDYCYRYVHGMAQLRERILRGALGEITAIDIYFHNAYAPNQAWCYDRRLAGGGCLLDLGTHLLDLVLWLQDQPVLERVASRLYAQGRPCDANAVEDLALAEFRQHNGASVRLGCSWNAHLGRDALIGMQVLGTQGGAAWRNIAGSFYDFQLEIFRGTACERLGSCPDDWGPRALRTWIAQLRHAGTFDAAVLPAARSAALIDEIYQA